MRKRRFLLLLGRCLREMLVFRMPCFLQRYTRSGVLVFLAVLRCFGKKRNIYNGRGIPLFYNITISIFIISHDHIFVLL